MRQSSSPQRASDYRDALLPPCSCVIRSTEITGTVIATVHGPSALAQGPSSTEEMCAKHWVDTTCQPTGHSLGVQGCSLKAEDCYMSWCEEAYGEI